MEKFEPEYIPYRKRLFGRISYTRLAIVAVFFCGYLSYRDEPWIFGLCFFVVFLIINIFWLTRHSRKYLKSLTITDDTISAVIVDKDKESLISSPPDDIRIRIAELVFGANHRRRNFKLQIDLRVDGKFVTVFEQYEVGNWNIERFDELFVSYCKVKGIPHRSAPTVKE